MQVRMAALQTDTPEVFPIEENKRKSQIMSTCTIIGTLG